MLVITMKRSRGSVMKKFLTSMLMLAVLLAVCIILNPTKAQAASVDDLTFALNEDGKSYSVTDCDESAEGEMVIPSTYNGKPVTTIGDSAFSECTYLTSVTIPDSVTTIGVGEFFDVQNLTGIFVDEGNPNYSNDSYGILFNKNKTELIRAPGKINGSYIIPDSVTTIGDYAFCWCWSLTSVTIPDSVTTIGDYAFNECA